MKRSAFHAVLLSLFCFVLLHGFALAGDEIPKAAWKRPIGLPLENPGGKKPTLDAGHIDDGYWQGAPVGGFGAGTILPHLSRRFARWHMKGGVHKYQTVCANQFAMYQKSEGSSEGVAQVLTADSSRARISRDRGSGIIPSAPEITTRSIRNPGSTIAGTSFPRMSRSNSSLPSFRTTIERELSGRRLPLACGQSNRPPGHRFGACFRGRTWWAGIRTFSRDFNGQLSAREITTAS